MYDELVKENLRKSINKEYEMATIRSEVPDATVTTNPIIKHLEKNFTDGQKIASILNFTDGVERDWEITPASITVLYTDGSSDEVILGQSLEAFLNTAYNFAY